MTRRWLDEAEEVARSSLSEPVLRYFEQGARDGVSAGEASAAWDALRLLPHVLRDVTTVDTGCTLLGTQVRAPVAIAPTTLQRAAHPDGELAMARGAAEQGSLMVVSSNAGTRFGAIAATDVAWWLQAYLPPERERALPMLARAVEAGARAVVLTVDTPVVGTKYDAEQSVWDVIDPSWLRVNEETDDGGGEKATDLGPADIAWLHERTGLPVVVKGVLRPDDARRCVQAGASAVWVSNHGGRQLDHVASTVSALPGVTNALGGAAEVYVDGGIRCGRHVALATALGATAAFVGRPALWSLAAGGSNGVARMLDTLVEELVEVLRLTGVCTPPETRGLIAQNPQFGF